jgi:hypothetical protein
MCLYNYVITFKSISVENIIYSGWKDKRDKIYGLQFVTSAVENLVKSMHFVGKERGWRKIRAKRK